MYFIARKLNFRFIFIKAGKFPRQVVTSWIETDRSLIRVGSGKQSIRPRVHYLLSRKERAWLRTVNERSFQKRNFRDGVSKSSPYGSSHVIVVTFETPELLFCLPRWFPLHNPPFFPNSRRIRARVPLDGIRFGSRGWISTTRAGCFEGVSPPVT